LFPSGWVLHWMTRPQWDFFSLQLEIIRAVLFGGIISSSPPPPPPPPLSLSFSVPLNSMYYIRPFYGARVQETARASAPTFWRNSGSIAPRHKNINAGIRKFPCERARSSPSVSTPYIPGSCKLHIRATRASHFLREILQRLMDL